MSIRTFLKPLSFIPALLVMYMIYSFSSQDAQTSSALSYQVSYTIVKTADQLLDADLEEWQIEDYAVRYNHVTRKIAHMGEYFLLAIVVSFPLYVYGLHGILLMLLAGLICVAFACTDEYHQSFVSGRAGMVKDVLIDSFGVFWGIVLVRIIGWLGRHTLFRPRKHQFERHTRRKLSRLSRRQDELEQQMSFARSRSQKMQEEAWPGYADHYADDFSDSVGDERDAFYQDPEETEDDSSDSLSEDMPLAKLLQPTRRRH